MSQNHICFNCNTKIPFGLQRCCNCGSWLFWKNNGEEVEVEARTKALNWPQKAQMRVASFSHTEPKDSAPAATEKPTPEGTRLVVVNCHGDYFLLEDNSWMHFSTVYLFGALKRVKVEDPTGVCPDISIVDRPEWKGDGSDVIVGTTHPGEFLDVWEVRAPYWVRVSKSGWLSVMWVPEAREMI